MSENNQQISQNPNLEKENRKEKINILRNMGINPFPNSYEVTYKSKDIIEKFDELEKNQTEVSIAGRIMLYRIMGKSSFLTIKDSTGNIQAYIQRDKVGDDFYNNVFKKLIDIGDIVGIKGTIFKTKTGEITIYANEIKLGEESGSLDERLMQIEKFLFNNIQEDLNKKIAMIQPLIIMFIGDFAYRRKDGVFVVPIGCLKD